MAYTKLVQTGNLIEVYAYGKEPAVFMHRKNRVRRTPKPDGARGRNTTRRGDNLARARKSFRRIVLGNLSKGSPDLLTLTMLDILDVGDAYKCLAAFRQKIRRTYGPLVHWIAVPEFQKRGAVHFHLLIWGLPYETVKYERQIRDLATLWGHGYVDIRITDGSPKLATYLSKYMSKAMHDGRLVGKKAYSATRGIVRPMSTNSPLQIDFVTQEFGLDVIPNPALQLERSYGTLWLGRCNYKRYVVP